MADKPITREEKYLAYLTGDYTGELPKPITRKEKYLYELCLKGMGGEVSPEEIKSAVNEYLEKNPVKPGATTEQAQQIEQNKTDIASLKEETGSLKEDLSTKITKFYASNQGETHLADSDNGKIMDMMIYGKSEQFTTTGKNLLKIKDGTNTTRGVTITAKDGVAALKGTATETAWATIAVDSFVLDGTYILSSNITAMQARVANKLNKEVLKQNKSATLENEEVSKVVFPVTGGKTYDISNILVQIEKGSEVTSYEPYTGGQPSPSPDYPQEIKSVVNPTVKVCGKNLLNYTINVAGRTVLDDGTIKSTVTEDNRPWNYNNSEYKMLLPAGTYIVTANVKTPSNSADGNITLIKTDNTFISRISAFKGTAVGNFSGTLTLDSDCEIGIMCKPFEASFTIQIEKGSTPTAFEPYHEQTVALPYTLNAIPVSSGGNVTIDGQQYVTDYFDVERGKRIKMVGKVDLGTLNYIYSADNRWFSTPANNISNCNIVSSNADIPTFLTDKYRVLSRNSIDNLSDMCVSMNVTPNIIIKDSAYSEASSFKEAISGTILYYGLATPEEIDLTPEEITALKALTTYYPTTNISINSEQLDGYTVFNYPISMANGWNYVKQQIGDTRDYIYDMDARTQDTDLQAAEAYVNSEYAVALTELEV